MQPEARRALVVVDVQREYFDGPLLIQHPPAEAALARIVDAVEASSAAGMPVVFFQHSAVSQHSEVFVRETERWRLHPEIEQAIEPHFAVMEKQYASAFSGTTLAAWLRERNVDTITIVGFMTNNCDIATAAAAVAEGFAVELLSDATGCIHIANEAGFVPAEELHRTLLTVLQSNFAAVTDTETWKSAVADGTGLPKSNLVDSARAGQARSVAGRP